MRYMLVLRYPEKAPGELTDDVMKAGQQAFRAYARALTDSGVLLSAEILQQSHAATMVSVRDGQLRVQDGPYADTREQIAGIFALEVPDLDAALAWAEKCPAAQWGSVEVRPSAVRVVDGTWVPAS